MNAVNEEFPWATALLSLAALIVIVIGGAAVIVDENYDMEEYFSHLGMISIGLGLLGIGRGIRSGLLRRDLR